MKDRKYYQHCDEEYRTDCAEMVLAMDTDQIEFFAKELLYIVDERRRVERQREIRTHLEAIAEHIKALHKMGMTVEIEDEEHICLFKPDSDFSSPIVTAKEYEQWVTATLILC